MLRLYPANKKVGRYASSDFRALDDPANFTVLGDRLRSWLEPVKPKQTVLIQGEMEFLTAKSDAIQPAPCFFPVEVRTNAAIYRCRQTETSFNFSFPQV
jgi:hypothetical protein